MLENDIPVCIAPLVLDKKPEKKIRLLGHGTNAGVLDFIYKDSSYVEPLYNYCKQIFSKYKFEFHFVPENSPLFSCMSSKELFLNYIIDYNEYDSFFSQLSKSVRQNVRTAYNRVNKDEKLITYMMFDKLSKNIEEILDQVNRVYLNRKIQWNNHQISFSSLKTYRLKHRDVIWTCVRKLSNVHLHVICIDDEIAAFFVSCVSDNHFYIPRLAMNDKFARYSPGILLIMEFLKSKNEKHIYFDLGRGAESYKTSLNGNLYKSFLLVD